MSIAGIAGCTDGELLIIADRSGEKIVSAPSGKSPQHRLVETAKQVLPGGTFGNLPGDIVIREGRGGRVWDEDGNEYVDFLLGSGPMLVGHGHPAVTEAAQARIAQGTTFFANNRFGIELAAAIVAAVPCAEQVRFVSTGSEADLYAMRAARAFKKRDKILKFEGGYHGMSDYSLMSLAPRRPGNFPQPVPDSAGIPRSVRDDMVIAPFNDAEAVASLVRAHRDELAGVIVEPLQRIIPPAPGFLEALRRITAENGVLLIFDEVVTGFRLAFGGAQEYYGVVPDLCTLGKVIGGGFPLAAIAGRADIMAHFDRAAVGDEGFLMQIGTLSGNPVAAAAGLATLEVLRQPGAYERLFATGRELMGTLTGLLGRAGIAAQVTGEPPLFDVVFCDQPIRDYRSTLRGDADTMRRFNALLRERGILKGESKYYVSLAHTDEDIRHTTAAWNSALAVLTA
jgi:glutamate-1-semialdehyde 2,1-aminomutase